MSDVLADEVHRREPSARRQATRERLLDAAIEVFSEHGLQGAAVETICSVAGFTRGAFYSNFDSKEQLFLAVLQRELERRAKQLREKVAEVEPYLRELSSSDQPIEFAEVARLATSFFTHEHQATTWFVLETEFLLLAMRDPSIAPGHEAFLQSFYSGISGVVDRVVRAAGRTFTLPVERAVVLLNDTFLGVLRSAALTGPAAEVDTDVLGERLAEVLFGITQDIDSAHKPVR